jgi:maltooligosyltrehalose trehalohydrolase
VQISSSPRRKLAFEYDARGLKQAPEGLHLKASLSPDGDYDGKWNGGKPLAALRDDGKGADRVAGDGIFSAVVEHRLKDGEKIQWGAVTSEGRWMVAQEQPPEHTLGESEKASYAPVTTHLYGMHRQGDGVSFRTWAPALHTGDHQLHVDIYNAEGEFERSLPMQKQPQGNWGLELPGQWAELEGKTYLYSARDQQGELLKTSSGQPVQYIDPYARQLLGQQRGLEKIFVDPVLGFETGWYDDSSKGGPNYADNPTWARFTVDNHGDADQVKLILAEPDGRRLSKAELLERLGEPTFPSYAEARPEDQRDVDVLRQWTLANSPKIDSYLWTHKLQDDGSIEMHKVESNRTGSGWTSLVNNFPKLEGLKYHFEVYRNGKLVGDRDQDGRLSESEIRATAFNEPNNNLISSRPGSARRAAIRESAYVPKFGDTPRIEPNYEKKVIFELHLGSFLGPKDNGLAPTAEDLVANLDYLKELGVTDIYIMPTSEFGGKRDWGYTTDHFFAGAEAYGFEMDSARAVAEGLLAPEKANQQESIWVNGTDAIRWLNDQLHKEGFSTMGDVVYNHTSGKVDGDNPLWTVDGDAQSFFRSPGQSLSFTPWGAKLAYGEQGVRDFISNNSVAQLTEMGFDHLRYDFTQVLHNTGSAQEQIDGMNALRQANRALQIAAPGTKTVAEDFSRNWLVAADLDRAENQGGLEKKGMGFQAVWNDGVREAIYKGAQGAASMDDLMSALLGHYGVSGWDRGVLYSHSHDEVGNSGKWVQRAAAGSKDQIWGNYARGVARSAATLTLTGPGVPMLWQGEEFLANNDFKHGLTSTWGYDTDWLNFKITPDRLDVFKNRPAEVRPEEQKLYQRYQEMTPEEKELAEQHSLRAGHFRSYADLTRLRRSSDAFDASSRVARVFTHNGDRVAAFRRGDKYVVATNFSDRDQTEYKMTLPPGRWKEVFNSNAREYGGTGLGNAGATVQDGQGLVLPAGSSLVFERQD